MQDRRSEQRRRNLFGIHPPACTCVDCSRKRSGLPPLSRLPTQPTEEDWEAFTKSFSPADPTRSPSDAISDHEQGNDGPDVVLPTEPPLEDNGTSEQADGSEDSSYLFPAPPPEDNGAYEQPQLTGFWGLPWGWIAVGFWIAMAIKNMVGNTALAPGIGIQLVLLDLAAVACLILKIVKAAKQHNLNAGRREVRTTVPPPASLIETVPEPRPSNDNDRAVIHPLSDPMENCEKIIDVASWVGVTACGVVVVVGAVVSIVYAFRLVPAGVTGFAFLLLGAYGTLFVAVGVASIAGFISRTMGKSNGE